MEFAIGDPTDSDHCVALQHEMFRCHDAFKETEQYAMIMIRRPGDRWISYKTYNAYSDFVHQLYEFMVGTCARDLVNTEITNKNGHVKIKIIEGYITHHIERILTTRREAIRNGTAPSWENDLDYYPEKAPEHFARDFRRCRNKVSGHVACERARELSLSDFYNKYHKYLYLFYRDALAFWGIRDREFPDLKEITEFTI
jgi:hypothetical protein